MKRRTRKHGFFYHLEKAQEDAREKVRVQFGPEIQIAQGAYEAALANLLAAEKQESWISRILSWLGFQTSFRRENIQPLKEDTAVAQRATADALERQRQALSLATKQGELDYLSAREERKKAASARAQRVAALKQKQRVLYLERSPSIRSAARFLKRILISEATSSASHVVCFYCGIKIAPADSHLEHKRPVCRGGDNRRSNLALSCSPCNLAKGRKTHEEYVRIINGS